MLTVIFYSFILLSSTFFVWLSEKGRTRFDRKTLLGIAFLLVFIPSAIRYDVGTDYLSYLNIFRHPTILENYKIKEPGFYFINWFLHTNGFHSQWMFATFAFIFTTIAFITYPRNNAWLLHFLFFSMLWLSSFNIIRQSVALSWCMLSIFCFFNKRYIWFVILALIATSFHRSAIFILLSGFIALIPLNSTFRSRIIPIVFIAIIGYSYLNIDKILFYIQNVLSLVGLNSYLEYFSNPKHFTSRNSGSGISYLAKILFSIYIIMNTKSLVQLNSNYWLITLLNFLYALAMALANNIIIFGRMTDTFAIAPIIGGLLLLQLPNNTRAHRLVLYSFLLFLLLLFIKLSFGIPTSYSNPKLMPFQTIFSE